ncbi:MAG: T9SS type A sorting domain-containing protein [Bacteroidetes bacterium]|nr:T9SS type A sorting domain-containing protein [Bacteroidota bacterium]
MNSLSRNFNLLLACIFIANFSALAQNDLPSPSSNLQSIKNGALIISLDTNFQKLPGFYNLKAYGLANELLQHEIPLRWAIKAGKTRSSLGSVDFSANVTRVYPDTLSMGTIPLRSSSFIIDSNYVDTAFAIIKKYGNNVSVFRLNNTVNVDVRYTLTHKPNILLLNSAGYDTIAVKYLEEAGISTSTYKLQTPSGTPFDPNGNWSLISETHWVTSDTGKLNPLLRYSVGRGANLMINCISIGSMENATLTMSTGGFDSDTSGLAAATYNHADLPIAQFLGPMMSPNGEYKLWKPKAGSSMRAGTYDIMRGNAGAQYYTNAGMKMRPNTLAGGNLFYLSGHDHYHWTVTTGSINDMNRINKRRIFLNSVFIPVSDSIQGIDFKTDVQVDLVAQSGWPVKNEDFIIYIIAKNEGPGTARRLKLNAALPLGLNYQSDAKSYGSFDPVTGIWSLDSLQKNQVDTLTLTVRINALGNIIYTSALSNPSYELNKTNNFDTLFLFAVSRPIAVNDTLHYAGAISQDYPVKINDSDEDGGPFANASIVAGPFRGTAFVLNGDSIRYTLTSGSFTGTDSLQYVTCDNYPLCDTAWFFINITSPLPVSLTNFTGKRINDNIRLDWYTLSEKNNDYFEVERSRNGTEFQYRGRIYGFGTSNTVHHYQYIDTDDETPVLYYRLQQFDFDGTKSTSHILALPRSDKNNFEASIYPNPSDGTLQVISAIGVKGMLSLTITDLGGRIISKQEWNADQNGVVLEFAEEEQRLAPGYYLTIFRNEQKIQTIKLVVR